MEANLYVDLWDTFRPKIVSLVKEGGGEYRLSKSDFTRRGNRERYDFSMTVVNCDIPSLEGSAVARDLKAVLDKSPSFRKYAAGKTVVIRLDSSFTLKVSVS